MDEYFSEKKGDFGSNGHGCTLCGNIPSVSLLTSSGLDVKVLGRTPRLPRLTIPRPGSAVSGRTDRHA